MQQQEDDDTPEFCTVQASSLGNSFPFILFSIFEDVHRTLDFGGALGDYAKREELVCKQQHLDKKVSK